MSKRTKGGSFEREICKLLSLWINHGDGDEGLWRTSCSGGRATVRRAKGKSNNTHTGDIAGITPAGEALCRHLCFELKTGYGRWSIQDELDSTATGKKGTFAHFADQAISQCPPDKLPVLITRRIGGKALIWLPGRLVKINIFPRPHCIMLYTLVGHWAGMRLTDFVQWITPEYFIQVCANCAPSHV